jgi:hypothetical protein
MHQACARRRGGGVVHLLFSPHKPRQRAPARRFREETPISRSSNRSRTLWLFCARVERLPSAKESTPIAIEIAAAAGCILSSDPSHSPRQQLQIQKMLGL